MKATMEGRVKEESSYGLWKKFKGAWKPWITKRNAEYERKGEKVRR